MQTPESDVLAIIVSYNTKALTLRAVASVLSQRPEPQLVVVDNASSDGSARALSKRWPDLRVIRSEKNLGFGCAVNLAAAAKHSRWILLLNPDAMLEKDALAKLVAFAENNSGHGIFGGRTIFPDGRLNPDSCQGRITPWSVLCQSLGLTRVMRNSPLFNPEGIGGWERDSVREVDIVFGAFFLIDREVWNDLGGFDPRYWLYGEDADLCLRARKLLGKRPLFTPDAVAHHTGGAARDNATSYRTLIAKGRVTVMRQHWPGHWRWLVRPLGLAWAGSRAMAEAGGDLFARIRGRARPEARLWQAVWRSRDDWLEGYSAETDRC